MANRDLIEVGERPEKGKVIEIEIVTGVDSKPELVSERCCFDIASELALSLAPLEGSRVGLGIELDAIGAERARPTNGLG